MHWLRLSVLLLYLAYLVVIVIALAGPLPLAETVLACLGVHFVGLFGGLLTGYDTYPSSLGRVRPLIIAWDVVQFAAMIALAAQAVPAALVAGIALAGIVGCFYKVYALAKWPPAAASAR